MSTTTPPPAPKKRPAFLEPDPVASLDKRFPAGQWVPLTITPTEQETYVDMIYKSLPKEFQSPHDTFAEKKRLVSLLAKAWNL